MSETSLYILRKATRMPARRLREFAQVDENALDEYGAILVHDICDDSRNINEGDAFLCLPRTADQAVVYARQAALAGAVIIITVGTSMRHAPLPCLHLEDMQQVGDLLRRWFETTHSAVRLLTITGTDGKTSTAWMLRQAIMRFKKSSVWAIGTLGWVRDDDEILPLGNTTPSLLSIHRLLARATRDDVRAIVLEASSHGIEQQRLAGLEFDAVIWTNLGHDHLEDHGGFDAYASIKRNFVADISNRGGVVVCNADNEAVNVRAPDSAIFYGRDLHRQDVQLSWEQELPSMTRFCLNGKEILIERAPVAEYHAENMAATALALHAAFGADIEDIRRCLEDMKIPPGRMQSVQAGRWQAYVDFAHTPEALAHCLRTVRRITRSRLLLVFGCGGERDREKRSEMGKIAVSLADKVWVTSDNPRHEEPATIAGDIMRGMPRPFIAEVILQLDRANAIGEAVNNISDGDVLIIAGKGHEEYMEIGEECLPWNDLNITRDLFRERRRLRGW
ncbi:MAG: UDP-N-acetylmuramoyl-L-alanyl-D-glutamate--2,6-diaminopimelate ligase [Mariprofundales bacterium]